MEHRTFVICVAAAIVLGNGAAISPPAAAQQSAVAHNGDTKPAAARPGAPNDYRLGAGDKLRIEVYKDPQLSQSVQIRPDGKITLPLVGDIEATGRTPLELRDAITGCLKEFMNNPVVTVIVVEATAAMAYVMGEVNHPGTVNMRSGPITVLRALAMAGGLKDFANEKNIRILRRSANGIQTIPFNYREGIGGGKPVYLMPGDTVVVT
jgi:polysaccharide export outer membrane protein